MKLAFFLAALLPLAGCAGHAVNQTYKIDDGGLPSAEMKAFERAHIQYQYGDARIEWDAKNCAVYEGTAPSGQRQQQPLTKEDGSRICSNP